MNLASPAPKVEPAVADQAPDEDPAIAEMAQPTEAPIVAPAQRVDPAVPFDDPMLHAPENITNPTVTPLPALAVEVLRGGGDGNADKNTYFESYAAVISGGAPPKQLLARLPIFSFFIGGRDFVAYGEVRKYILVKGYSCFVYLDETDLSPLYGIALDEVYPILEDSDKPDKDSITVSPVPNTNKPRKEMKTVLLKYKLNQKIAYQFTFDTSKDPNLAQRFLNVFDALYKNNDEVKKNKEVDENTKNKEQKQVGSVVGAVAVSGSNDGTRNKKSSA